jgi:outer membrane protein
MTIKTGLAALLLIFLCAEASAKPISLRDAVQEALAFDPAIERAEAGVEQGQSALDFARAKGGPTLGAHGQLGLLETDFTADRITQVPRQIGLRAQWSIYQSGAQTAAVEASRHEAVASENALLGTREATVLSTVEAYAQLWLAVRALEVSTARVETFRLRMRETEALERQGVATRTDIALAESRLASAEAAKAGGTATLSAAKARMSRLTGLSDPQPMSPFSRPLPLPGNYDEALRRAYSSNFDLAAAQSSRDAASYRVREARGRYGPKVSLNARATTGEDIYFFFEDPITDVGATVTVDVPLFTNGQKSAKARGARAGFSQAEAQVRWVKLEIQESVSGLWNDLTARREALSAAQRAEAAAATAAEGAQKEYEAGLRTLVESLDAEDAFRTAQVERFRQQTLVLLVEARLLSLSSDLGAALLP